jgi:hypothetical protein
MLALRFLSCWHRVFPHASIEIFSNAAWRFSTCQHDAGAKDFSPLLSNTAWSGSRLLRRRVFFVDAEGIFVVIVDLPMR